MKKVKASRKKQVSSKKAVAAISIPPVPILKPVAAVTSKKKNKNSVKEEKEGGKGTQSDGDHDIEEVSMNDNIEEVSMSDNIEEVSVNDNIEEVNIDDNIEGVSMNDNSTKDNNANNKKSELFYFINSLDRKRKKENSNRNNNSSGIGNDDEKEALENTTIPNKKRKRRLEEIPDGYDESLYYIPTTIDSGENNVDKKIELKDLLATLQDETGYIKQPLSPPLPKRIQEKFNRQAAYEETKKEISKWEPIVKRNRESDHLEFSKSSGAASYQPSNNTLAGTFKASTELEKQVENILEESGAKEKDFQQYEELELNKLTIEEIQSRRRELRIMRELMFREELKAKRIAKIKSKTYHKIKKKEREKNELNLEQLSQLDPELGHQEQLKLEAVRAQERMTLKHKNTSRWAKQALKYGRRNDAESRQAIVEQLQLHEKLKRKISGLDSDDDELHYGDNRSDYSDNEEEDIETIKAKAFDELASLSSQQSPKTKGVLNMKFMKEATEKKKQRTNEMIQDFVQDLENGNFSDIIDEDDDDDNDKDGSLSTRRDKNEDELVKRDNSHRKIGDNPGRMVFGRSTSSKNDEAVFKTIDPKKISKNKINLDEKLMQQTNKSSPSKLASPSITPDKNKQHPKNSNDNTISDQEIDNSNPWLQNDTSSKKSVMKIKKENKKRKLHDDEEILNDVEIDLDKMLTTMSAGQNFTTTSQAIKNKKKNSTETLSTFTATDIFTSPDQASEYDDELDTSTITLVHKNNNKTPIGFSQRELVARAFANDNVVEEFEAEKLAAIDEDTPKEKDLTLPGWGSWAGKGVKKKPTKNNNFRIIQKPVPGEGIEVSKRKDANLKHVIINEKRIKKATKYLATQIPYPYETREQYERSLRNPLGKEWNTYEVFQKMVKPRVTTKMGTIIDPLEKPET
ncbi:2092_t:CDS:10 [Ambispora gerdemannii]|uniref:2092_t:CDS:1 n=1 Tax=Ambispora gerdemannii TaxID=144530 RepID=A0A9N9G1V5_9GLOM|nr:2092_t:CDS:10 [Ambispora gerdemannii]